MYTRVLVLQLFSFVKQVGCEDNISPQWISGMENFGESGNLFGIHFWIVHGFKSLTKVPLPNHNFKPYIYVSLEKER